GVNPLRGCYSDATLVRAGARPHNRCGAPKHDLDGPVEPAFLSGHRGCRGRARAADGTPEVNAWITIAPDDTVVIRVSRSEMGQGIFTALPMLIAEELECDWAKVKPELVPPAENLRRRRAWGDMSTNASRSVAASQLTLRQAGATAREMLIAAAAAR